MFERTNREAALSDTGVEQVENACRLLEKNGVTITLVKYSLAASCIDTANIVGKELKVRIAIVFLYRDHNFFMHSNRIFLFLFAQYFLIIFCFIALHHFHYRLDEID